MIRGLLPHANKIKYILNENLPTILSGAGIAGTVATAVLTGRATFKAADLIAEQKAIVDNLIEEDAPPVELSKTEKTKLVWRLYLPPIGVGSLTIGCIFAANRLSSKKIAALAAAVGISERAFNEYKDKVIERLGPKQDDKIRDEVAQDRVTNNPVNSQVHISGTGEVLCFDMLTGRYFTSTMEEIRRAENKLNYELIHYNSCSLSTFYDEIGLEPTTYTDMVGWSMGSHLEVKFTTTLSTDNRPCLAIDFSRAPTPDYDRNPY